MLSAGLVLVAALASSTHWLARPHLVTHLLTVVFAWELQRGDTKRMFLVLPPLMLLWANLHGAFFTGLVLIGIYLVGSRRRGALAGLLLACLAASLINPNGWRLHEQVVQFLRTPELAGLANEFRSPNFHSAGTRGFVLELLVLAGLLLIARPRLSRTELGLLAVWGYFALHSVRNVPIFVLVATPVLAKHWNEYLTSRPWPRFRDVSKRVAALDQAAGGPVLAVLIVAAVWRWGWPAELLAERFPVTAVNWVRANPEAVAGEMFNDYGWGGYLMWALPERKVFIDGRNDFYGKQLVEEFLEVDGIRSGWEPVVRRYRVGWTLLPPKHGLNALLALRSDWTKVHEDEVAVIYARR